MEVKTGSKKTVNWTRDMIYMLIQLYEAHPNLWNVASEDYENRNLRKLAIDEIAQNMGLSVSEINDKIHNLRCQFQSIQRKRYKTKSGQAAGDNFKVKWEFYEALKFIGGPESLNEAAIDTLSNANNASQMSDETQEFMADNDDIYQETQNSISVFSEEFVLSPIIGTAPMPSPSRVTMTPPSTSSSRVATPSPSRDATPPPSSKAHIPPRGAVLSKKRKQDMEQQAVLNRCLGVMSKLSDSFEIFGDYVEDELRTMNVKAPDLYSQAKRQIQRIFLDMNDAYDTRVSPDMQTPSAQQQADTYDTRVSPDMQTPSAQQQADNAQHFYEHSPQLFNL